jgi:thiamine biosynthesis lipoprotein
MIHRIDFHAMGCEMVAGLDTPETSTPEDLAHVPALFEDWEQHLSRFRESSELSAVNRSAGKPTQVSDVFAEVFEAALDAEQLSGGLVTPVLLDPLVQAGYDRSFDLLPREQDLGYTDSILCIPRLSEVDWDASTHTICLPPDLHLDFGGVAKGWAAQQSAERLSKQGPALVDAAGDIAISDEQSDGQPWLIGIADPFDLDDNLELLQLGKCGVATSGRDSRRWRRGNRWYHHIIDPRTGLPAETEVLTVTVIAPTVTEAEIATKTILISGSTAGLDWLEANPELAGMLVLENGERLYSRNMESYIWR